MANADHEKVLRAGIDQWNRWRREHGSVQFRPDLCGIQLDSECWLEEGDFRWTDLRGARLSGTILAKSNFFKADLSGADLVGAFVPNSTLIRANLTHANLSGAILNASNFLEADLSGANLKNADLKLSHLVRYKLIRRT